MDTLFNRFRVGILYFLPGFLVWLFLLSPLLLGFFYPDVVVFLLTFLTFYWAWKVFNGFFGLVAGFRKFKKETAVEWWEEVKKLDFSTLPDKDILPKSLDALRFFLLIPIYSEPFEVLYENFLAIKKSTIPNKSKLIVYAIEQRFNERVIEDINRIKKELDPKGEIEVMHFVHPSGIPGEVAGVAGANRDFAARRAVEELTKRKVDFKNYIFSTTDCDVVVDKNYYARIAYLYLTSEKRLNKFYETAVHIFDNNTWNVPTLNRVGADSVTISILSSWSTLNWPTSTVQIDTFSAYSCGLVTAVKADFYDVKIGIDDTMFYWRAFKAYDGDFEGVPFFVPLHADATEGPDFISSHMTLYRQQLRWGWGVIVFPFAFVQLLKAKGTSRLDKLAHFWNEFEMKVIYRVVAFLLTFGFSLLTLVNKDITQANYAYAIPKINSLLMTTVLVGIIPTMIVTKIIKKPMPKNWNILKKIFIMLTDSSAIFINLLTFGFVPWVEAETKMMMGKKYKKLNATPKFRKI